MLRLCQLNSANYSNGHSRSFLFVILAVLFILQIFDAATTVYGVNIGVGKEAFLSGQVSLAIGGVAGIVILKLLAYPIIAAIWSGAYNWSLRIEYALVTKIYSLAFIVVILLQAYVVIHNAIIVGWI